MMQRKSWMIVAAAVAVVLVTGGLFWFQPWKLWVDTRVDEALPATAAVSVSASPSPALPVQVPSLLASSGVATSSPVAPASVAPTLAAPISSAPGPVTSSASTSVPAATASPEPAAPSPEPAPAAPVVLRTGSLLSHEHETSGTLAVVQLPDGSRVLTLENLSTSDGPDVRVWLSSAPVIPGEEGWYTFADAPHVDLGALKGNLGNQVYEIPADVDLDTLPNVSLWCQRFSVSFGAAELSA